MARSRTIMLPLIASIAAATASLASAGPSPAAGPPPVGRPAFSSAGAPTSAAGHRAAAVGPRAAAIGSRAAGVDVQDVASTVETDPVSTAGDSADDPAIWVNASNPGASLVLGNNKSGALESYDLSGHRVQRVTGASFYGNVDVRGNLVAVASNGIRLYTVNPSSRQLKPAQEGSGVIKAAGEGLCLYDPGAVGTGGGLYAFTVGRKAGKVDEVALTDVDGDGLLAGSVVRTWTMGSESEGCVVDDSTGSLFVSQEDVAVWRYSADPDAGTARTKVAAVGSSLPADAEGLAIAGGYLLVSAQNVAHPDANFIDVYASSAPYRYVSSVRVVVGTNSDDCDRTDGIAAYAGSLGPAFPGGILVCQDGSNSAPGSNGNQDFKYVPWQSVLAAS